MQLDALLNFRYPETISFKNTKLFSATTMMDDLNTGRSMENLFSEMDCYLLAGGKSNPVDDFSPDGEICRLERGYRRYATLFEKVKLVLKRDQAKEHYLNYPYVCDEKKEHSAAIGVKTALNETDAEAVFIGSSEISDFPLDLVVRLVREYDGEMFLGYCSPDNLDAPQPLFGIFNRKLVSRMEKIGDSLIDLVDLVKREGRLLPLPDHNMAVKLGCD